MKNQYLVFLKRTDEGSYESLTGQYDPDNSFFVLQRFHISKEREALQRAEKRSTEQELEGISVVTSEESPISNTAISTDNSPAAIAAARERGGATASKDIKAGTLRILYFGKPWSVGKPLVDDPTGYRVQILADCVVTPPFVAEVEAYNNAVREFHGKNPLSKLSNQETLVVTISLSPQKCGFGPACRQSAFCRSEAR